ncbi:MAG: hypothetical protein AAF799_41850 [Myxococcota bacterium]
MVGLGIGSVVVNPAYAATSSTEQSIRCDDMLIEVGATQGALTVMEEALERSGKDRERMGTRASMLAQKIAAELSRGATDLDVQVMVEERKALLRQMAKSETLRAALDRQHEALVIEVDRAQRRYITCVETALD